MLMQLVDSDCLELVSHPSKLCSRCPEQISTDLMHPLKARRHLIRHVRDRTVRRMHCLTAFFNRSITRWERFILDEAGQDLVRNTTVY